MKFWIGLALCLIGVICVICGCVWQQILCYQMFGFIFDKLFIPHWSAWFYLGMIPIIIGWIMANNAD